MIGLALDQGPVLPLEGDLTEDVPERRSLSVSGPVLSVFQLRTSTFRFVPLARSELYEDESFTRSNTRS